MILSITLTRCQIFDYYILGDVVDYRDKLVFWIERYDRFWEVKTQNHKTGDTRHSGENIMRLKNL